MDQKQSNRLSAKHILAVMLALIGGGQRYVFRCDKYNDALDNLRAAQLAITYLWRALEEYGVISETQTLDRVFAQFCIHR